MKITEIAITEYYEYYGNCYYGILRNIKVRNIPLFFTLVIGTLLELIFCCTPLLTVLHGVVRHRGGKKVR